MVTRSGVVARRPGGCGGARPAAATAVDRWYSARVYAALQPLLTSLSNLAPFALLDAADRGGRRRLARARRARSAPSRQAVCVRAAAHRRAHDRLVRRPSICCSSRSGASTTGVRGCATTLPVRRRPRVTADAARRRGDVSRSTRLNALHDRGARGRMAGGRRRSTRTSRTASRARCATPASRATSCRRDPKRTHARLVFPARRRRRHDRSVLSRNAGRRRRPPVRAPVRRRARVEPPGGHRRRRRSELRRLAGVRARVAGERVQRLAVPVRRAGARRAGARIAPRWRRRSAPGRAPICGRSAIATRARSTPASSTRAGASTTRT